MSPWPEQTHETILCYLKVIINIASVEIDFGDLTQQENQLYYGIPPM